jgi:hypothetical protein
MEFIGFIKGLLTKAIVEKEITIPKGTIIRIYEHKMVGLRIVDGQNTQAFGQTSQAVLESWKQKGGPNVSYSGESFSVAKEDQTITGAYILNGSVAHKILFHAVFGDDKAALYEEVDECYMLANPTVAWSSKDERTVYAVDINEIPEITSGTIEVVKITKPATNAVEELRDLAQSFGFTEVEIDTIEDSVFPSKGRK